MASAHLREALLPSESTGSQHELLQGHGRAGRKESMGGGSWLCPSEHDRARTVEMQARLGRVLPLVYGSLGLALVGSVHSLGWWPLLALALTGLHYLALSAQVARSERPELWVAWILLIGQLLVGSAIAATGGPKSPLLPWLVVAATTLPLRFTGRGVAVGLAVTVGILFAASLGVDAGGFIEEPSLVLMCLAVLVCVSAISVTLMGSELQHRDESTLDPLTGLLNRRRLAPRVLELSEQAQRTGESLCLIACDLDEFKLVNDGHGHARGDVVLRETADEIRSQLRSFELVYRVGGDEFLIVLPGMDLAKGLDVAERLRSAVEQSRPGGLDITMSLGVGADLDEADAALYEAKRQGRNRCGPLRPDSCSPRGTELEPAGEAGESSLAFEPDSPSSSRSPGGVA